LISLVAFQAWNAFGESTGDMPDNLFAFNTMPQVPPHQFTTPSVPYVGSGTPQVCNRCFDCYKKMQEYISKRIILNILNHSSRIWLGVSLKGQLLGICSLASMSHLVSWVSHHFLHQFNTKWYVLSMIEGSVL
jgi:hypothetical protein